jgi:hypothetical protein
LISSSNSNSNDKDDFIQPDEDKNKKKTFFGKIGSFFDKTKENIETKFKEMKIGEKAKGIANTTKTFVQEKSKDIMVIILYFSFTDAYFF